MTNLDQADRDFLANLPGVGGLNHAGQLGTRPATKLPAEGPKTSKKILSGTFK